MESKSLRIAYGEALVELAEENSNVVVLDADLSHATMTHLFKSKYPDRHFNMGIAEADMMCHAAGMASMGLIPFASTFAIFGAGRGYEQIRNSISYPNFNVKFGLTHSGLSVGEDGGSHQSIEDIALMRVLPGMTVLVPCDAIETKKAVKAAAKIDGPVFIRVARPVVPIYTDESTPFEVGKGNVMVDGNDVCIITAGLMMGPVLEACEKLKADGISVAVINLHTIKPIDDELILKYANKCKAIVTVEEHSVIGGLGSAVADVIVGKTSCKFAKVGIQDRFGQSGKPDLLFEEYGLTCDNIIKNCKELL